LIDRTHALPITKQAEALGISRGAVYYVPRLPSPQDLRLMRRVDEVHLEMPWAGARGLVRQLKGEFPHVGRRHMATVMRRMGIAAIAPQPGTSRRHRGHPVFPYLLRNRVITRPNDVWAMDITYIPMPRGFVYLAAVMDWASRRILSWRVSVTLDSAFCVDALEEAIARYGAPAIVNTDQGSQFTSGDFTRAVLDRQIQLSMDGRGSWRDNIFIERFWRSLKYEEVYLHAYPTVSAAKESLGRYITLYNARRLHTSLADQTPDEAYFSRRPLAAAA
jgi:putative transposase